MLTTGSSATHVPTTLTPNQIRGFLAAWGGWALDGMDAFIYALVLVPALTELLPASGIEPTAPNIGYFGSILMAMFLLGWGASMVWGPISDRIGRVRALMLTILCYSVFTFLCGLVTNIWQLAVLRILVGIGIGGEQPVGAAYVAEELPEDRRKMGAGLMHTGYYFGFFFAAIANYFIGANYGWRWMFVFGGVPALFIGFIRYGVRESTAWQKRFGERQKRPRMRDAFGALFSPAFMRRTIVMSLVFLVSIIGLWAGSIYVPTAVTQIAIAAGYTRPDAARIASYGSMVLAIGTILGCVLAPLIAERIGRRWTMALYFVLMGVSIAVTFGYVFYLPAANALASLMVGIFFLGLGGANFALYTLWLPEQYPTDCRGSAIGFVSSIGRFVGVGMVFLLASGISYFGSLGVPVALTSLAFILGLAILPLAEETRGKPLPA